MRILKKYGLLLGNLILCIWTGIMSYQFIATDTKSALCCVIVILFDASCVLLGMNIQILIDDNIDDYIDNE